MTLLSACGATRHSPTGLSAGGRGGETGAASGAPATAGAGVAAEAGAGAGGSAACDPTQSASAPLVMLEGTRQQESVRGALGAADSQVMLPLPTAAGMPLGLDMVSALHQNAHELALELTSSSQVMAALTGCAENDESAACRDSFIQSFGARAFRRRLTEDDTNDLRAWFDTGQELGGNFASGVRAVVEVTLQSPDFLYVPGASACGSSAP